MTMLTRRSFGKLSIAAAALTVTGVTTGCPSESDLNTAVNDIPVIINILQPVATVIVAACAPEALPLVNVAVGAANTALNLLVQEIQTFKATKSQSTIARIDALIQTANDNLSKILGLFHTNDASTMTYVQGAIALALSTLSSIQLLIPAPANASTRRLSAPQVVAVKPVVITPAQLKTMYNSLCVFNGFTPNQIR